MITFITWLRCLAALLITNAHYNNIYPINIIANGGLIRDIIFFAVSGYCLTNIRTDFFHWYGKRIMRILPAVILITIVYMVLGQYDFAFFANGTEQTILFKVLKRLSIPYPIWLSWFIYPTYYHFVGSILVLYIPYYIVMKNEWVKNNILKIMFGVFCVYLVFYILLYDKTYYHIDTVREPMIRFLFLESMLLGAWFRLNDKKLRNVDGYKLSVRGRGYIAGAIISFIGYFISKILFSHDIGVRFQLVNQILIFVLLYFIMRWFSCMDSYLETSSRPLYIIVDVIAKNTLEIYLVQYVLIDIIRNTGWPFPLNWVILTATIMFTAFLLHIIVQKGMHGVIICYKKIRDCK